MKLAASIALLLLLALVARAALADDKAEASARYEKGLERYGAKDYEKAIVELKAAFELDARPEYLYAWAQAERLSGDCESAAPLYRRFLEGNPPADLAGAAAELLKKCEETLAAASSPAPVTPPKPPPAPPPEEPDVAPPAWWKDPVGGALVGTGLVALGGGATFWVLSSSAKKDADAADTYQAYEDNIEKAKTRRTIAIAGLAVGGSLIAGGVIRYLTLPGKKDKEPGALTLYFDGVQGGVLVAGEF